MTRHKREYHPWPDPLVWTDIRLALLLVLLLLIGLGASRLVGCEG